MCQITIHQAWPRFALCFRTIFYLIGLYIYFFIWLLSLDYMGKCVFILLCMLEMHDKHWDVRCLPLNSFSVPLILRSFS